MKLTTKRNRWYFWRELFQYMIPMILIVGAIDVFRNFMICPLHPEWSAPCSVNRILAAIYGALLLLVIVFEIISARMLRKIKKKIEAEFIKATNHTKESEENKSEEIKEVKLSKPKKAIKKTVKKSDKKGKVVSGEAAKKTTKNVSTKKKSTKK